MKLILKIATAIIANGLAVWVAARLVDGVSFQDGLKNLVWAGLILGAINTFIRPVLKLLSFPFILLSLGFFSLAISLGLIYLLDYLLPAFQMESLAAALWGSIVISLVNYFLSFFRK